MSAERHTGVKSGYIPTLDGWRTIAILLVLAGHVNPWSIGPFSNQIFLANGYRGVQVFFALSGYLICTRLLREEQASGTISLSNFYMRRLFRIQPAALTYLATVTVLTLAAWIPANWRGITSALLMTRNLWPLHLKPGFWYTEHFWSLAVEEHFYLMLPAFLLFVRRRRVPILLGILVCLEIWTIIVETHPGLMSGADWQTAHRTDISLAGILMGSTCAIALRYDPFLAWCKRLLKPWVALLVTVVIGGVCSMHRAQPFQFIQLTLFPVMILSTVLHPQTVIGRLLELAPVRWVGRISYSIYLWQQIFFVPRESGISPLLPGGAPVWLAVTLLFAMASYYLVETPMIRFGHRFTKRSPASGAAQAASSPA